MFVIEGSDHLGKTTCAMRLTSMMHDMAMNMEQKKDDPEYQYIPPVRYQHMTRPSASFDFLSDYRDLLSLFSIQDRFHLGGLVWHNDVITRASLKMIESWIYNLGSYIVIFATDNEDWYRSWLRDNPKRELFDIDSLLRANDQYMQMITGTYKFPVQHDDHFIVGPNKFPQKEHISNWINEWLQNLEVCHYG